MQELKIGRGYVYSIQYHIVWCVKYRRKIFYNQIDSTIKQILHQISVDNNFTIENMETDADHVHLLIDCSPQHHVPSLIKALKGVSAKKMFIKHPELKQILWGGNLWNPTYFVATVSENTKEQIKQYIDNQKVK